MKRSLTMLGIVSTVLLVSLQAETRKDSRDQYQTATVVSVDQHVAESNYIGSPTDAPLQADDYSYDISLRLGCNIYVGRYESATDYLPSAFSPRVAVEVRLQKRVMYINLPGADRLLKMGIVSHRTLKGEPCTLNN